MNSNHKNGEFSSPLEDDLDSISQAYQELGQEEPPALLDQAVLNSAHRAVEKQSHWMQFGWLHGLTTAAIVVLAFTIILQQGDPAPGLDEIMPLDPAMLPRADNAAAAAKSFRVEKKLEAQKQDMDIQAEEFLPKEVMEDRSLPAPASIQTVSDQPEPEQAPSLVAEPEKRQIMGMAREQADPEKELETILDLKRVGDDSWKQALAQFIERYPDYPLPEGLQD